MQDIVTGFVSCVTISETVFKPDILHLYILKSAGHRTLAFCIVNLSCALLGESKFPMAVARLCSALSFHWIVVVCPIVTDTTVSNVVLEFFCNCD